MKKNKIFSLLTTVALGTVSLGIVFAKEVDAATYRVKLIHNAAIYNNKGKRKGKTILKKGKIYTSYNVKSIKGKKYFYLSKGKYIKSSNAKKYISIKKNTLFTVNVRDTALGNVYTAPNFGSTNIYVNGPQNVYEEKADSNGTIWYKIGDNKWLNSYDTNKAKGTKMNKDAGSILQNTNNSITDNTHSNNQKDVDETNEKNYTQPSPSKATQSNLDTSSVQTLDRQTIEETGRIFVKLVNEWRATQGVKEISYTNSRYGYDIQRAIHDATAWDTTQQPDYHVGTSSNYAEVSCLIKQSTPEQMAKEALWQFLDNDASANYGHRNMLKRSYLVNIGVGLAPTTNNGYYKNGVAFVASVYY